MRTGGAEEGEWREGWLLKSLSIENSPGGWGEECGPGTGSGLDAAVSWAFLSTGSSKTEEGGRNLAQSGYWYIHSGGAEHPGKNLLTLACSALPQPWPLYDFFFISKFYTEAYICFLMSAPGNPRLYILFLFLLSSLLNPVLNKNLCML